MFSSAYALAIVASLAAVAQAMSLRATSSCECPTDNNGNSGNLINVFPGYQCAYADGACTWADQVCVSIAPRMC